MTTERRQAASPVSANSCQISYRPGSNAYYLLDDAATRWLGPATAGSKVTLQNSQCTLNAATSTAVKTASGVTVTYAIEFKAIFSGAKNTYLYLDGAWNRAGAWTIPMPTSGTLMSPTSGAGAIQIFSGQFIYPEGFAGVADAALLVQAGTGSPHSCMMDYRLATNGFYLLNDAGNTWLGPISAGSSLILENSQCVLNGAACKSTLTPTLLTISYAAAFKPAFAGQKDTYLYFKDLWSQVGGWTVPSATSGASLAPLAGMGSAAVFTGTVVYPG
ncbi:MAG: hypothetical protein NTY38_11280, partial [Acidobacteria bacterium]|nr:hypothetical protein [Acidobacteriota bacterium]